MKFIIFHGSFGSVQGNWFPWLKEKLKSLKQKVILPQFPVEDWDEITKKGKEAKPKNQTLDNWLIFFEKNILPKIKKEEKLCFIGHSLGPLFILHLVDRFNLRLDYAIFVSPFFEIPKTKFWQIDLVNKSFYKKDFDFEKLKKLIPVSYVLYSDNDPYVDKELSLEFAEKLKSEKILIKGGGHLNSEAGFYDFPLIFELCVKNSKFKNQNARLQTLCVALRAGKNDNLKLKIRKANIFDLKTIQKLNFEVFQASFPYDKHLDMDWPFNEKGVKYFREALTSRDYCCLLAYDNNLPVGYLIGVKRNFSYRKNKVGEIDNMGVTKNYRGKGIGTALINEFKKWCQKKGLTHIRVSTYFGYDKAINFYKNQGLKEMDLVLEGEIK